MKSEEIVQEVLEEETIVFRNKQTEELTKELMNKAVKDTIKEFKNMLDNVCKPITDYDHEFGNSFMGCRDFIIRRLKKQMDANTKDGGKK